jgi:hypothetical protein
VCQRVVPALPSARASASVPAIGILTPVPAKTFGIHGVGYAWRQWDVGWDARARVHNLLIPALGLVVHLLIPAANRVGLAGSDMEC